MMGSICHLHLAKGLGSSSFFSSYQELPLHLPILANRCCWCLQGWDGRDKTTVKFYLDGYLHGDQYSWKMEEKLILFSMGTFVDSLEIRHSHSLVSLFCGLWTQMKCHYSGWSFNPSSTALLAPPLLRTIQPSRWRFWTRPKTSPGLLLCLACMAHIWSMTPSCLFCLDKL